MIRPLRKRHRILWLVLALLLPMGFMAAMFVKSEFPVQRRLTIPPELPEGKVIKNAHADHITASLYQRTDGSFQIFITLDQPLKVPVTTLYVTEKNRDTLEGSQFIGKVNGKGTYLFPVQSDDFTALILYDAIHQKIVQTLSF